MMFLQINSDRKMKTDRLPNPCFTSKSSNLTNKCVLTDSPKKRERKKKLFRSDQKKNVKDYTKKDSEANNTLAFSLKKKKKKQNRTFYLQILFVCLRITIKKICKKVFHVQIWSEDHSLVYTYAQECLCTLYVDNVRDNEEKILNRRKISRITASDIRARSL